MDLFDHLAPLWLTLKVATFATGLALTAGVGVGWLLAYARAMGEYGATLVGRAAPLRAGMGCRIFSAPTDVRRTPGRAWRDRGGPPGRCPRTA